MSIMENPTTEGALSEGSITDTEKETSSRKAPERPWKRYLDAALGLKNYWYPVFFSKELEEGNVLSEEVCGERILFKRTAQGVFAVQDRCAHRGVAFSARPECYSENTVTCWFHGFTFDVRDGNLMQVLSHPESNLKGKLSIPSYKVREEFGLVWVFIGDEDIPFEHDLPPALQRALAGGERRAFFPIARVLIPCDWRLAIENGFDPGHVYGHRTAEIIQNGTVQISLASYPPSPKVIRTDTTPGRAAYMNFRHVEWEQVWEAEVEGVLVSVPKPQNFVGDGSYEIQMEHERDTSVVGDGGCYLPCLFEAAGFPDGIQTHFEWYVPVDETHHLYTIMASLPVTSDEEEAAFFEDCRTKWGDLIWSKDPEVVGFNNFDAFGREQIAHGYDQEDFWHRERLYKPDAALVEWRMFVTRNARGIVERTDLAPKGPQEPSVVKYIH